MLVEFSVSNFRSLRDRQSFSLVASADRSLPGNATAEPVFGDKRLLHAALIFGANASGKSNLFAAMAFVKRFITDNTAGIGAPIGVEPFLLAPSSAEMPSEFELTFVHGKVRYQYGFVCDSMHVREEWLLAYPKGQPQLWYERKGSSKEPSEFRFGSHLKGERQTIARLTRPNALFLSTAAALNHEQLTGIWSWFKEKFHIYWLGDAESVTELHDQARATILFKHLNPLIRSVLRAADLGISEVVLKPVDDPTAPAVLISSADPGALERFLHSQQERRYEVLIGHKIPSEEGERCVYLPLKTESLGTQRLFWIAGPWLKAVAMGETLVVDELDASLHPHLVRMLLSLMFTPDINKNCGQVILNTHDTTLLDLSLLRRDQIWFVEKDQQGASHLYPLLEFRPRKDEALQRGYLAGRYGAIPLVTEPSL